MTAMRLLAVVLAAVVSSAAGYAQVPDRALTDAMRAIYSLRNYTAFDWISARYQKGTLTLEGFVRSAQLKEQAESAAHKVRGIEVIDNRLEVLSPHPSDDDVRVRAYIAIYGSSALERYAPRGQLNSADINDLRDSAHFGLDGTDVGRGPHAIHIVVNSARVLLLGEVRTAGDSRIAEGSVRTLQGVLGVVNRLRVPSK
jgi:osmotically-inducible protein OsmY